MRFARWLSVVARRRVPNCLHGVGERWQYRCVALADRPLVPEEWVLRIDAVLGALPRCRQESAWTGTRWRVGSATVAHVFGGEDQLFRITFRGVPDDWARFLSLLL